MCCVLLFFIVYKWATRHLSFHVAVRLNLEIQLIAYNYIFEMLGASPRFIARNVPIQVTPSFDVQSLRSGYLARSPSNDETTGLSKIDIPHLQHRIYSKSIRRCYSPDKSVVGSLATCHATFHLQQIISYRCLSLIRVIRDSSSKCNKQTHANLYCCLVKKISRQIIQILDKQVIFFSYLVSFPCICSRGKEVGCVFTCCKTYRWHWTFFVTRKSS